MAEAGSMVVGLDGKLISASGELTGRQDVASTVFHMLQDVAKVLDHGDEKSFQRLTVSFGDCNFAVAISQDQIHVRKTLA
eukprot:m.11857 g.11857  ORF g.11857 m.11857 type:complete len:80 (-) comp2883_c0_seq1:1061-1300(-)